MFKGHHIIAKPGRVGGWVSTHLKKICSSNWKSSRNRGENKTCLKPLLGCPWKLVTIVSKLVYNLLEVFFDFYDLIFTSSITSPARGKMYKHMCQGLNSLYFHIIGDGHQPNSRGLYNNYKDSLLKVGWPSPIEGVDRPWHTCDVYDDRVSGYWKGSIQEFVKIGGSVDRWSINRFAGRNQPTWKTVVRIWWWGVVCKTTLFS